MNEEFLKALKVADRQKVAELIDSDPSLVNEKHENGVPVVMQAIYDGQRDIADLLVARGAALSIFEAAALGRIDRVTELLADPDSAQSYSVDGFSALGLACFFGNKEVVDLLLARGATPNMASKNFMRVTPLHSAVAHRDGSKALEMTKSLLDYGAEVNVAQEGGWTPLHQAAAHGQTQIVALLLDQGADLNAKSNDGQTPIDMAIKGNHKETEELLLRAKPDN